MENNSCSGFEDDFGPRSSISSLLSSGGGGGAEAAGSAAFFDSIAGYLDSMNQRAPLAEALLRKGPGVETPHLHMDNIISSTAPLTTGGEAVAGFDQSAEQWQQNNTRGGGATATATAAAAATKVGKKRSRASRRAPTTVLTTDTSNFRAMVQEFTGIPPAPFASSSPFSRRLDFLGTRNLSGAANPFLLRPYPHRMPAQSGGAAPNFPAPPLFQSLLHPNLLKTAVAPPLTEAQVKAGLLEELGLNPPLLPDLVPSERRSAQWPDGGAACKMTYSKGAGGGGGGGDMGRGRTLDVDNNNGGDVRHNHHSNGMRADRIVDSWISSSDQTLDKLVQ